MRYRNLGNTGLQVSELCLGAMTFGSSFYNIGTVDQKLAISMVARAWEAGVNFFDTADVYSFGESEAILGEALKANNIDRDKAVIATKVRGAMSEAAAEGTGDVNNQGLSRKHIMASCDASLRRLGTDHIDLYQIHGWDANTPLEETLSALNDLVRAGKVRYIGASNLAVRQLMKALGLARLREWEPFVSLQAYYSLVGRDLEDELLPLCREEGLGVLPWSPLAGGLISGKYRRGQDDPSGARRSEFDFPPVDRELAYDAVDEMDSMAEVHDGSISQVALAWLLAQPGVTSIIIGARTMDQLEDNLQSVSMHERLSAEEIGRLTELTRPETRYPKWMIEFMNAEPSVESEE